MKRVSRASENVQLARRTNIASRIGSSSREDRVVEATFALNTSMVYTADQYGLNVEGPIKSARGSAWRGSC